MHVLEIALTYSKITIVNDLIQTKVILNWCCMCKRVGELMSRLFIHCSVALLDLNSFLVCVDWVHPAGVLELLHCSGGVKVGKMRRTVWSIAALLNAAHLEGKVPMLF